MRKLKVSMKMNFLKLSQLAVAAALLFCGGQQAPAETEMKKASPKRVLVVSVTAGFRHSAIPTGNRILGELAEESGAFTVDYAQQPLGDMPAEPKKPADLKPDADESAKQEYDAKLAQYQEEMANFRSFQAARMMELKDALQKLSPENLKNYEAVVFNSTTGDLPLPDKAGFLKWIEDGHAFIGIHAATDTFRGHTPLDPYVLMLGAEFKTHGPQVEVEVINQDPTHPACKHWPKSLRVFDEIYQMNGFERGKVHGLLTLDKHPNTKQPGDYPIAWCKMYGKGRVFYTSLGHREDVWDANWREGKRMNDPATAEAFQKHLLGGVLWALGLEPGDATPQTPKSPAP
jgi:type 1 glutamine amidotransferase